MIIRQPAGDSVGLGFEADCPGVLVDVKQQLVTGQSDTLLEARSPRRVLEKDGTVRVGPGNLGHVVPRRQTAVVEQGDIDVVEQRSDSWSDSGVDGKGCGPGVLDDVPHVARPQVSVLTIVRRRKNCGNRPRAQCTQPGGDQVDGRALHETHDVACTHAGGSQIVGAHSGTPEHFSAFVDGERAVRLPFDERLSVF